MKKTNWSTCKATGKRRFRSEHDAEIALIQARKTRDRFRRGEAVRLECRYYECDSCGGFHLTKIEAWVEPEPLEK